MFDTADVYGNAGGSETLLGQALGPDAPRRSLRPSSVGHAGRQWAGLGRPRAPAATSGLLSRAACAGWAPTGSTSTSCTSPDPNTPIEETLAALTEIVAEGKVRYIGSSNFAGWQVIDADWTSRTSGYEAFISAQNEYSWLNRSVETELVPALEHTGQSLLPYFPLASRTADRQVPPRRAGAGRHSAGPAVRYVLERADFDTARGDRRRSRPSAD